MKKVLSVLLCLTMLLSVLPMGLVSVSAATTLPAQNGNGNLLSGASMILGHSKGGTAATYDAATDTITLTGSSNGYSYAKMDISVLNGMDYVLQFQYKSVTYNSSWGIRLSLISESLSQNYFKFTNNATGVEYYDADGVPHSLNTVLGMRGSEIKTYSFYMDAQSNGTYTYYCFVDDVLKLKMEGQPAPNQIMLDQRGLGTNYAPTVSNLVVYEGGASTFVPINVSTQYAQHGAVSSSTFAPVGSTVTLTAQPDPGYVFLGWRKDNGTEYVSTDSRYTFTVTSAVTYVPVFQKDTTSGIEPAKIIVSIPSVTGGTTTGAGIYTVSESVTLKATPSPGYCFIGWKKDNSNDYISSSETYTFTASTAATYTPVFEQAYTLEIVHAGANYSIKGAIGVSSNVVYRVGKTFYVRPGDRVTIVASVVQPQWSHFFDLDNNVLLKCDIDITCGIEMSSNRKIQVSRVDRPYGKFSIVGEGELYSTGGSACSEGYISTDQTITATPREGWEFSHYEVLFSNQTTPTTYTQSSMRLKVNFNQQADVKAVFKLKDDKPAESRQTYKFKVDWSNASYSVSGAVGVDPTIIFRPNPFGQLAETFLVCEGDDLTVTIHPTENQVPHFKNANWSTLQYDKGNSYTISDFSQDTGLVVQCNDRLKYTVSNYQVTVDGFNVPAGSNVIVPSAIDGYPVTSIATRAFAECGILTSVTIPKSVTNIGIDAFSGCVGLTDVWYGGLQDDKNSLAIADGNEFLCNAKWHYGGIHDHEYSNACDVDCNICGEIRAVGDHSYDDNNDTDCNACGYVREVVVVINPPTNVKVETVDTGVSITWTASSNAERYGVFRSDYTNGAWTIYNYVGSTTEDSFTDTTATSGMRVRYLVFAYAGNDESTGTLSDEWLYIVPVKITTQPKHTYVKEDATAKVTVKAMGDGLKYTWYLKNDGATKYSKSSITTNTYSVKMSDASHNRRLYCVITDQYGNKVQTQTVILRRQASITTQPKSSQTKNSATAKVTVGAKGDGLKYTWYIKNAGQTKYSKSSVTSSTYSVKMSATVKDRYVYCVVTDKYGKTVKTNTVVLRMAASIITQPKTTTVKNGATAKVTVKAAGDGLKYTWYIKNVGQTKYSKSSVTSATYSVKMSNAVKGRYLYCVVTDKYGKTVKSNTVMLKMS